MTGNDTERADLIERYRRALMATGRPAADTAADGPERRPRAAALDCTSCPAGEAIGNASLSR